MSHKFFTLIYGDEIHAAPKSKIIPAADVSKLINAEEVLKHIQEDAEKYRMHVTKDCETIKEQAYQEGFQEGFRQWAEQLVHLENEISSVHKELESLVIPIALKAAKKIVSRELDAHPDAIVDIVATNLKVVSQHKKINIYVNKNELEILNQHKQRLRDIFESLDSLSIRERADIQPGGCVIETEIGIINAQIEQRWAILERAFEALAKKHQSAKEG